MRLSYASKYAFVGLALAIFFLLVTALSEYIAFGAALAALCAMLATRGIDWYGPQRVS
jgi:inner membrane protein involved in colicin E2 resistance